MRYPAFTLILTSSILLIAGCGGGGSGSGRTPSDETLAISAAGGRVATGNGTVALDAPAGAVERTKQVTVFRPKGLTFPTQALSNTAVALSGATLFKPIGLTLAYAGSKLPTGDTDDDLAIYRLDGGQWTLVGGRVDANAHTVSTSTTALGTFAVFGADPNVLVAEATTDVSGLPYVRLSWKPDALGVPRSTRERWQVYRNGLSTPISSLGSMRTSTTDTAQSRPLELSDYLDLEETGGVTGSLDSPANQSYVGPPPLVVGNPYSYRLQQVYSVQQPGGGIYRYFLSGKAASGQATALEPPRGYEPQWSYYGSEKKVTFSFQGVGSTTFAPEYVIEVSVNGFRDDPALTFRTVPFSMTGNGMLSRTVDFSAAKGIDLSAYPIEWRVGVRNPSDRPGPVPDAASGQRYIYGGPQFLTTLAPSI